MVAASSRASWLAPRRTRTSTRSWRTGISASAGAGIHRALELRPRDLEITLEEGREAETTDAIGIAGQLLEEGRLSDPFGRAIGTVSRLTCGRRDRHGVGMDMEFLPGVPAPALSGSVVGYTGFAQRAHGPVRFRELPCTYVPLILDLGEGWSIADARRPHTPPARLRSFVAGLTDGPVLVEHGGAARCLQVDLTPLGARRLLGLPMSELANRSVALEDVLGRDALALVERLADAPDWPARFALVDRALGARLAEARPIDAATSWALGRVVASGGRVAIGQVARELGWSHRRLISRFRDGVGLAPKSVARIVRFERLIALVGAEPDVGWARAAAGCGFFDQAHLAREVRDLADLTPTALRAESVNSVQDRSAMGS